MTQLIHSILDLAVAAVPRALAGTLGDDRVTFGEVADLSAQYANALHGLGLRRGDRLVLHADFTLEQAALFFATQYLGVTFTPVNPAFETAELKGILAYLRPALVVQDAVRAAQSRNASLDMNIPHAMLGNHTLAGSIGLWALRDTASRTPALAPQPKPDDTHAIFLTSGSTGKPKGVMISHRASWMRSYLGASRFVSSGGRGELLTFPMFHWAGWNYLLENWAHRRAAHFVAQPGGDEVARAIARHDPAFLYAIPAIWERVLASSVPFDGSRLRAIGTGTSRFDPALLDRLKTRFPNAFRGVFYGSTEFGGAFSLVEDEIARRPGAVGLPGPGNEARIVDGELQLRSATMMDGYFELPEQTAEVFTADGWYRSGDLAQMDKDGFVSIEGRVREVIRSAGETIAPAEVELALRDFPGLRGVAVIGLEDATWGELVCAVAEVESGAPCPTVEAVRAHLQGRIAPFKHPRRVVSLPELPRTPATGQIMRARIRQMVEARAISQ